MKKDRDYAYLIGSKYKDDLESGMYVNIFLDLCKQRNKERAIYRTLLRIKHDHIKPRHYKRDGNDDYTKTMGYLYMYIASFSSAANKKDIAIPEYEYCLAMIDEDFLNKMLYTTSEKLAFLNANIKVLKPYFRTWKKSNNIKKVNMSDKNITIEFSGTIDANTKFILADVSKEEVKGIGKFIKALDKAPSNWPWLYGINIEEHEKWRLE